MPKECSFCRIVDGDLPSWKVYEDGHTLAILDKFPVSRGHTLVITKVHYGSLADMPFDQVARLYRAVAVVADAVREGMRADGINILQCDGRAAWQSIPHVHVHVIPR